MPQADDYQYIGQNSFNQPVWIERSTGKKLFGHIFEINEEESDLSYNRWCIDQQLTNKVKSWDHENK